MYIILTTKPAQYRTEPVNGITVLETFEYRYGNRHIATYCIASADPASRVRIVETTPNGTTNVLPTKFFEHFATRDDAFASLKALADAAHSAACLVPSEAATDFPLSPSQP